ncbi:glucose-6-phosphate dehydrogenase [Lewinellaceae bacterium SD302]|nr:glucose-6-phosphate dehydrogenase [Lewinellaceae bacterium SD302]
MSSHPTIDPHILVIFGASGDLAKRKLVPAVFELFKMGYLPDNFVLLGCSRTDLTDEDFRKRVVYDNEHLDKENADEQVTKGYADKLFYQDISSYTDAKDIKKLGQRLRKIDAEHGTEANYIFYLSTPPKLYADIPAALSAEGLAQREKGWGKLIVEKPFGYSEESAKELNELIQQYFPEDDIYRIDHYLGKETVQNLLVTRFANGFFEPLWNRNYIHSVQITAAETVGVGSRGGYYDESGAMRDMVQNHLLQVLAHVAMEPPIRADAHSIRNEKLKLFQSLRPLKKEDVSKQVIRGQYLAGDSEDTNYRDAEGVPDDSKTETYVGMKFFIDNWRWAGVPFFVRTGKNLPMKLTEVVITWKTPPQSIFSEMDAEAMGCDNQLIMRIYPHEGMALEFGMKVPGEGFRVKNVDMDFFYSSLTSADVPEAYERLLLDCMKGDATLYARGDSVEAAWAFIDPILDAWKNDDSIPLHTYKAGTWGPEAADRLWDEHGNGWRNPTEAIVQGMHYSRQ